MVYKYQKLPSKEGDTARLYCRKDDEKEKNIFTQNWKQNIKDDLSV